MRKTGFRKRMIIVFSDTMIALFIFFWLTGMMTMGFPKPNIVLIVADDMGYSDAGCYGSEIRTPSLDSLAEQGCLNTRCYTTPRCSPSRASLLTGRYPQSVGVGHLDRDLNKAGYRGFVSPLVKTLPEVLKTNGYRTYMSGKWHLGEGEGNYPWNRGFDRYWGLLSGANGYFRLDPGRKMAEDSRLISGEELPPNFYMTEAITNKALDYLDDATKGAGMPFFLYVAYTAPHTPLEASRKTIESYQGKYGNGFESVRQARLLKQKKLKIVPHECVIPDERKLPEKTTEKDALKMAIYAAQVTDMDEGIGKILEKLESRKLSQNTIVIFVSDNGATAETPARNYEPWPGMRMTHSGYGRKWATVSNTPYMGYKIGASEGGVSVPCLVRYPGKVPAGMVFHAPVRFIDLMPTLLNWADVPSGEKLDGVSMAAKWSKNRISKAWSDGDRASVGKSLFFICEHEKNKMLLMGGYKLVAHGKKAKWQLYAFNDRMELKNLEESKPDVVQRLQKIYRQWVSENQVDETIPNYYPPRY